MKITQHLYVRKPFEFAQGDYEWSLAIRGCDWADDDEVYLGEVKLEIDMDRQTVVQAAKEQLDRQESAIREKLNEQMALVQQKRAELLALPQPDLDND